jgi:hypothetical protein
MGRKYVDGAAEATLDDFAEATLPMAVKGDGLRQNWVGRLMARLRPDFPTGFF